VDAAAFECQRIYGARYFRVLFGRYQRPGGIIIIYRDWLREGAMPETDTKIQEDLRKARRNKVIYLVAGLGLFGVGAVLFVIFIAGREVPSLLMGCVAFIWGALLVNQALRSRDIEDMIEEGIARSGGEAGAGGAGKQVESGAVDPLPAEEEAPLDEGGGPGEP